MNHYEQAMTDALELREFGHGIEAKQVSPQYAQHVVSTLTYGAMLAQVHATLALVDAVRQPNVSPGPDFHYRYSDVLVNRAVRVADMWMRMTPTDVEQMMSLRSAPIADALAELSITVRQEGIL